MLNAALDEIQDDLTLLEPIKDREMFMEVFGADTQDQNKRIYDFLFETLKARGFRFASQEQASTRLLVHVKNYGLDFGSTLRWLFIFYESENIHQAVVELHVRAVDQKSGNVILTRDFVSTMIYKNGKIISSGAEDTAERAREALAQGNYLLAISLYEKAIRMHPGEKELPELLYGCATAYEALGKQAQAHAKYKAIMIGAKRFSRPLSNPYLKYVAEAEEKVKGLAP